MTEIEKLLAVLDMTEDSPEQYGWLLGTIREHKACCPADLAFRLRDEAKKEHPKQWLRACFIVSEHLFNPKGGRDYKPFKGFDAENDILQGKPIWWIVSAIRAKQLAKDKQ